MKFNSAMGLNNLRLKKRQQRVTPHITPAPTKTLFLTKHHSIIHIEIFQLLFIVIDKYQRQQYKDKSINAQKNNILKKKKEYL